MHQGIEFIFHSFNSGESVGIIFEGNIDTGCIIISVFRQHVTLAQHIVNFPVPGENRILLG